ncbi:MAG: hypothetical protein OHK0046_45760 [Anaerolineae bacterium]
MVTMASQQQQVDQLFEQWATPHSPGCRVAVVQHGEVIYAQNYGMASLEHHIPISEETVFYIASVAKQITAACVGILIDRGQVGYQDDIRQYFPELPDYGQRIEVQHLIHHTSGLRDYLELALVTGWQPDNLYTQAESLNRVFQQRGTNFAPGAEYLYSNTNYLLLAELVARVSGLPFEQFAAQEVFAPLGMTARYRASTGEIIPHRASGYAPLPNGGYEITSNSLTSMGSGGAWATVDALVKWDANFYHNRLNNHSDTLLALLQRCTPPAQQAGVVPYAFGLMHSTYRGLPTIRHAGAFKGFCAQYLRFPAQALTIICCANVFEFPITPKTTAIAEIFLADEFTEPAPPETPATAPLPAPVTLEPAQLAAVEGVYFASELTLAVRLYVKDGQLMIQGAQGGALPLTAYAPDTFGIGMVRLLFDAKYSGFTWRGDRVRQIHFDKLM